VITCLHPETGPMFEVAVIHHNKCGMGTSTTSTPGQSLRSYRPRHCPPGNPFAKAPDWPVADASTGRVIQAYCVTTNSGHKLVNPVV
jgi:hypothetical protein